MVTDVNIGFLRLVGKFKAMESFTRFQIDSCNKDTTKEFTSTDDRFPYYVGRGAVTVKGTQYWLSVNQTDQHSIVAVYVHNDVEAHPNSTRI